MFQKKHSYDLALYFSVYLLKTFQCIHGKTIYEIIQEIQNLYNSGYRNLKVYESALKTVITCLDCEIQEFLSMHDLELCAGPCEVTWPYVAIPLLTLWAQMTALTFTCKVSNPLWLCLQKIHNLITFLNFDTNVLHFVLSHLPH